MKRFINIMLWAVVLLAGLQMQASESWALPHEEAEYMTDVHIDRAHHAAFHDVVTEQDHNPFSLYSVAPSPLDDALRLTSFLLGEIYAAAEIQDGHDHLTITLDKFSFRALDLYALYVAAQIDIKRQLDHMPEKTNYLLGEVGHLRERIAVLLDCFCDVVNQYQNDHVSTVKVTLERILRKTSFLLSV